VPALVPAPRGESIDALHDRLAYVLHTLVARADADPRRPRAMLVCTHAACMIAIGRVLTGAMPAEVSEEDFGCFTASLSVFRRRGGAAMERAGREAVGKWDRARPEVVPEVRWRGGEGVAGGWVCERNADCSFLSGGEERGW
jgi:transcription factor C subunit 7